ncbi:MAG: T9SS type A sorting domain-containing protein, partial [Bacteroidota bacterium]
PVVNDTLKMKIVSPEYFIVSNRDIIKDERVRVFPNPATNHLWIDAPHLELEQLSLYDAYGQLVIHNQSLQRGRSQVLLSTLPSGIYLLKIQSPEGILTRRIVLESP